MGTSGTAVVFLGIFLLTQNFIFGTDNIKNATRLTPGGESVSVHSKKGINLLISFNIMIKLLIIIPNNFNVQYFILPVAATHS